MSIDRAAAPMLACHRPGGGRIDTYSGYSSAPVQPGDLGEYVVPAPVDANTDPYSGYAALPTLTAFGLAGAERVLTPEIYDGAPGGAPDHAAVAIGNEGAYSGYAALPTPAASGLVDAERVLTPEVYDGAPDGAPGYAFGPLPFGGASPQPHMRGQHPGTSGSRPGRGVFVSGQGRGVLDPASSGTAAAVAVASGRYGSPDYHDVRSTHGT